MFFFSDLLHKSDLKDIFFVPSRKALITALAVRKGGKTFYIPPPAVLSWKPFRYDLSHLVESSVKDISITKHLLNRQIIDVSGNKIVRVNDVLIGTDPDSVVMGVDTSIAGVARWFGLSFLFGKSKTYISWADVQILDPISGALVLEGSEEKLKRIHPEDLADHLEKIAIRRVPEVLEQLSAHRAALVIDSMDVPYQVRLFKTLSHEKAVLLLEHMAPDESVDVLQSLPTKKKNELLSALSDKKQRDLQELLSLPDWELSPLVSNSYLSCMPDDDVGTAITRISGKKIDHLAQYVYVLREDKTLLGVFDLSALVNQSSKDKIAQYVRLPIVVNLKTPLKVALKRMLKYRVGSLPVINEKRALLGIVTFDDIVKELLHMKV